MRLESNRFIEGEGATLRIYIFGGMSTASWIPASAGMTILYQFAGRGDYRIRQARTRWAQAFPPAERGQDIPFLTAPRNRSGKGCARSRPDRLGGNESGRFITSFLPSLMLRRTNREMTSVYVLAIDHREPTTEAGSRLINALFGL